MEKVSKRSVNYQLAARGKERCGNCSMYREGRCTLVEGKIRADYWCEEWEKK